MTRLEFQVCLFVFIFYLLGKGVPSRLAPQRQLTSGLQSRGIYPKSSLAPNLYGNPSLNIFVLYRRGSKNCGGREIFLELSTSGKCMTVNNEIIDQIDAFGCEGARREIRYIRELLTWARRLTIIMSWQDRTI